MISRISRDALVVGTVQNTDDSGWTRCLVFVVFFVDRPAYPKDHASESRGKD